MPAVIVGTCSSDEGTGLPDDISQQEDFCGAACNCMSPPLAGPMRAFIGQSGGHCIDAAEPAEEGKQKASDADGATSAIIIRLTETTLYPIRIMNLYT